MQNLDINNKKISYSFLSATESITQYVKPQILVDFRDSRHLSNVVVTTNDAHSNNSSNQIGYYFDKNSAIDGLEYESFPWGVADAKDNYGQTITCSGKYRAMPANLLVNLKYGWWSNSKSNSTGIFTTQPYLDINFDSTTVNKVKIVTTQNYGQIKSLNLAAIRSNGQTVFNQTITFNTSKNQFEKIINLGDTYTDIARLYVSVISTKNPNDRARLVSIAPLYRVDISDYVIDVSESRVRDLHETSLPIAGSSQSSCDVTIDNTGKEFNLLSSSQYGKYLEKDLRLYVAHGWLTYGRNIDVYQASLTANLSSSELTSMYISSTNGFPPGDVLDSLDEGRYFVVTVNKDKFNEEQILVKKTLSTGELSIAQRGFNNTDASSHNINDFVTFDPVEYVWIGERYIEDIRSSSNDMKVIISSQDSSKFFSDKVVEAGFFKDSSTVPEAIRDLLYLGNHPYHKYFAYNKYHHYPAVEDSVLYFKFNDESKNSNLSTIHEGVRFRVYQPAIQAEIEIKDIQLDINEKELTDMDRALGLSSSVSPSFVTVKDAINFSGYSLSSDNALLNNEFYQGVIDGFIIPKNQYDPVGYVYNPLTTVDGLTISYDECGVRLYVDDNLIYDGWNYTTELVIKYIPYHFIIGVPYKLRVEFYHSTGNTFDLILARSDDPSQIILSDELVTNVINDYVGYRNPSITGSQKNHNRNYAIPTKFVSLSRDSSMPWYLDDKSCSISNTAANTSVVDSFIRVPYDTSWDVTNLSTYPQADWSVEYIFRAPNGPYGANGEYISSFANSNPNSGIEFFYSTIDSHGVRVKTKNITSNVISATNLIDTVNMPESNGWNHICVTYYDNEKKLSYYVDGDLRVSSTLGANVYPFWGQNDLTIGGRGVAFSANVGITKPTSSIASNGINLDVDEFAIYKKTLSSADVKKRYVETQIKEVKIFPFLYGINESIYQIMQNISFADLGRFYVDERNVGVYQHYYALFESSIDQHANVQKIISEDNFIIDATIQKNLQVNSVVVKVAGVTASGLVTQSIWRASDPTTLGVLSLSANINTSSNSISTSNFDVVPFPKSGYIVIDDEIIKYNNKNNNSFLDVERGVFGTTAASHNTASTIREVKYFNFQYDKSPCVTVKPPFITGILFEDPAEIDILRWVSSPFKGELIISASKNNDPDSIIFAEGTDPTTNKVAYTAISGIPVQVTDNSNQIIEQKAVNSDNRRKYGLKEVIIESPFITDASQAQTIADFIISKLSEPIPIMDINTSLIPNIQVGDRIKISVLDQFDIINSEYWVVSISSSIGSQYNQSMTLRKVV